MSCPDDNTLAALADGALDADARAALEQHLDRCVACAELLAELGGVLVATPAPPGMLITSELDASPIQAVRDDGTRVVLIALAPDMIEQVRRSIGTPVDGIVPALELVEHAGTTYAVAAAFGVHALEPTLATCLDAVRRVAALHDRGLVHDGLCPATVRLGTATPIGPLGSAVDHPYRAPERRGGAPSPASDQFALCATLWHALAGARPFTGATPGALAISMRTAPTPPAGTELAAVFPVLARGLAVEPAKRWPDLHALVAALERPPARARSKLIWLVLALMGIGALALALR